MGIFRRSAQADVDLRHLNQRLDRIESALAALQATVAQLSSGASAAGTSPAGTAGHDSIAEPWLAEVRELKASGKLIHAIKVYRERTGVGLKEAKEAVERLV